MAYACIEINNFIYMGTKRCKLSQKEYLKKQKEGAGYVCKKCQRLGKDKQLCKPLPVSK